MRLCLLLYLTATRTIGTILAASQQQLVCSDDAETCTALLEWDDTGVWVAYGPQQVVPVSQRTAVAAQLDAMERYMAERIANNKKKKNTNAREEEEEEECRLKHESCLTWAASNECEHNPGYMQIDCAPACLTCEMATQPFHERCPMPTERNDIWQPGDLGRMFERMANDTYYRERYNLQVVRRPSLDVGDATGDDNDSSSSSRGQQRSTDFPWIVQLDDFLSQDECSLLIAQGASIGYEPSPVLGSDGMDMAGSSVRTSSHAWCRDACYTQHAVTILQRIENLTGVPEANYEHLQLLEYQPGQYYKAHTDFIDLHANRAQGVRILTVFLYLNDVEEGKCENASFGVNDAVF